MLMPVRGRSESAFTLVELIVVMLILGILAAIAIPQFGGARRTVNQQDAVAAAHSLQMAVEAFRVDHGGRAPANVGDWTPGKVALGPYDTVVGKPYMRSGEPEGVGRGTIVMTAFGASAGSSSSSSTMTVAYAWGGATKPTTYTISVTDGTGAAVCSLTNDPDGGGTAC